MPKNNFSSFFGLLPKSPESEKIEDQNNLSGAKATLPQNSDLGTKGGDDSGTDTKKEPATEVPAPGKPRPAATLITDDPTIETNIRAGLPESATLDSGKSEKSNPWFIVIAVAFAFAILGAILPFIGVPALAGLLAIKVTSLAAASLPVMAVINAGLFFLVAGSVVGVLAAAFVGRVWGKKPRGRNVDYTLLADACVIICSTLRSSSNTDLAYEVDDKNKPKVVLKRDCDGLLMPAGPSISLPKGTEVVVMQSLGEDYTVLYVDDDLVHRLVRINGTDADALGEEAMAKPEHAASTDDEKDDSRTKTEELKLPSSAHLEGNDDAHGSAPPAPEGIKNPMQR